MKYEGILAEVVRYPGANGDVIEGYFARPLGPGPFGSVVVLHHGPAWDEWTWELTNKIALHGYAVMAPHLYFREGPDASPDDAAAAARAAGGVPDARVLGDADGSVKFLRAQTYANGKVGIIGFCMGGRLVYLTACNLPTLDAAVDCWGGGVVQPPDQLNERRPKAPIEMTPNLSCPLLGIFGNDDTSPDRAEVDQTEETLKKYHKTYEFHRYDGAGHAFLCWDRPLRYRTEQAVDAWSKIFSFFERYLRAPIAAAATPAR